jgi:hypothetical protein
MARHLAELITRQCALITRHRALSTFVALGAVLRTFTILGYHPALLYNDTFEYVDVATRLRPYEIRPDGYSFFLWALEPAHSFLLVIILQHLLGLATAILAYGLVRRFGLPAWAGCLAAAPILFDGYQIELEHVVLSDTLFTFLVVATATLALRARALTPRACAGIGILLAAAMITRPAAVPVIIAVAAYLLFRRVGWRSLIALVIALAAPLGAYGLWYRSAHHQFALDDSTGIQLYGRVGGFADCRRMHPDAALRVLCPSRPGSNLPAPAWVWYSTSPLHRIPGPTFTPQKDALARRFAVLAIVQQPGDYLAAVGRDLGHAVSWERGPYPNAFTAAGWPFPTKPWPLPPGGFEQRAMTTYERGFTATKVSEPFARIMRDYQQVVVVRGPMLVGLVIIGLAGLIPGRRRTRIGRGDLLVVTAIGLGLALVPIFTVQLDYRYLLPSYPFLAISAVLGAARLSHRSRRTHAPAPAREHQPPSLSPAPAP